MPIMLDQQYQKYHIYLPYDALLTLFFYPNHFELGFGFFFERDY